MGFNSAFKGLKKYVVVRTLLRLALHSGRFTYKKNKHSNWCVHMQAAFTLQTARSAHTMYLFFSYDCHNKQRSFPWTARAAWSL